MSLLLASTLFARPEIGLNDIREFVIHCRDGASRGGPEAAALILLAQKANSFYERMEGIALTGKAMNEFVEALTVDVDCFQNAVAAGDTALVTALNRFATTFSRDVAVS